MKAEAVRPRQDTMTHESDEGVAYLMALKRSGDDGTASAAAPAREAGPVGANASAHPEAAGTPQLFHGAEKRRSPRFKCEGSAELFEEGCDVRTWASFTDISLHGCYVEAQATYPAGTRLHMKMEAKGVRFETNGSVRVSYPYLGMGIAFVDMTDESRSQLQQLLGTVSRSSMIMGPGIASALLSHGPMPAVPLLSDPAAAVQALIQFFEKHQTLGRDDFLRILRESQPMKAR